jgi:general secretion pathway protein D
MKTLGIFDVKLFKVWMVILFLAFGIILSAALAQPAQKELRAVGSFDNLVLIGSSPLRYFIDSRTNTLFIPGAMLAARNELPEGMDAEQKEEGLYIRFHDHYRITVSGDEKRLQAVRIPASPKKNPTANPQPGPTAGEKNPGDEGESKPTTEGPQPPADPTGPTPQASQTSPNNPSAPSNAGTSLAFSDDRAPQVYYMSNASATAVAATLTKLYSNLRIEVDERQRALLVLVNPADRALVEALIKMLDAPRPQVFFEAEVVEINRNQTLTLGIDYDNLLSFKLTEGTPPANILRLGTISRGAMTFGIAVNFLQEQGAAKVLARPRVATLDGLEAKINATQTTPLIVPVAGGGQSVQNITTGIQLRMLPKVAPDGTIEVQVNISVSSPTGVTSQGVPQFASRDATTTIRVKDGEPIAIGGLLENRIIEGVQKVPLLGDIPLLGELFKNRTTNESNTDLVIMITPRLITPHGP